MIRREQFNNFSIVSLTGLFSCHDISDISLNQENRKGVFQNKYLIECIILIDTGSHVQIYSITDCKLLSDQKLY